MHEFVKQCCFAIGRLCYATTLFLAGYDDKKLAAACSVTERNGAAVRGAMLVAIFILNSGLSIAISVAVAGYSFALVVACVFIAFIHAMADHYARYRARLYTDGLRGLEEAGIAPELLPEIPLASKRANRSRLALSLVTSLMLSTSIGLVMNREPIEGRIVTEYKERNKPRYEAATANFVNSVRREQTAYTQKMESVERLKTSLQNDVRAAVRVARGARRDTIIAAQEARQSAEQRIADAEAKLAAAKKEIDQKEANRDLIIEREMVASPGYVPKDRSLLRQLKALYVEEVQENPWTLLPIALIELFILLTDLTVLSLAALWFPSTYATAVTRRALVELVDEAKRGVGDGGNDLPPSAPSTNPIEPEPPTPPQPVPPARRRRGRPRKNGFDPTAQTAVSNSSPAKKSENG